MLFLYKTEYSNELGLLALINVLLIFSLIKFTKPPLSVLEKLISISILLHLCEARPRKGKTITVLFAMLLYLCSIYSYKNACSNLTRAHNFKLTSNHLERKICFMPKTNTVSSSFSFAKVDSMKPHFHSNQNIIIL